MQQQIQVMYLLTTRYICYNVLCADVGVINAPTLDVVMHVEPKTCPLKFEHVSHVGGGGGPAPESPMHLGGWCPLNFLGHVPKV